MDKIAIIGEVLGAAGKVIAKALEQVERGDGQGAQQTVQRFVAVTDAQLDDDRASAEDILNRRFGG